MNNRTENRDNLSALLPDQGALAERAADAATMHKSSAAPDPFDPSQFAANSTINGGVGITKELVLCPVRKPNRQEFVRVHPSLEYQLCVHILKLEGENDVYLVMPGVAAELPGETKTVTLRLAVNRQGALFLWPVPEPSVQGNDNTWNSTARTGSVKAEGSWVRMVANMPQKGYDIFVAPGTLGTPVWPDRSMREILTIAFGETFVIRDGGHPVVRRLLGKV